MTHTRTATVHQLWKRPCNGALFVEAGTVAPSRQNLSLGNMEVSYGVGFSFHSNSALVGRLDLASSKEVFVPLLRFEHVF